MFRVPDRCGRNHLCDHVDLLKLVYSSRNVLPIPCKWLYRAFFGSAEAVASLSKILKEIYEPKRWLQIEGFDFETCSCSLGREDLFN